MHSPFVFDFITTVLNDETEYPDYSRVEELRHQLLRDNTYLVAEDFGAGSVVDKSKQRTIASIAKHAAKPAKYGQLLYRMVKKYRPARIIELGTSLGITTSYISLGQPQRNVITMEGAASLANAAEKNFEHIGISNAKLIRGRFEDNLAAICHELPAVDFAFIDGNHRLEPTINYFEQLLAKSHNDTILVFDDIHWSKEMETAWHLIKQDSSVRCSIDLFFIGIVFFRKEFKEKQDFVIRF